MVRCGKDGHLLRYLPGLPSSPADHTLQAEDAGVVPGEQTARKDPVPDARRLKFNITPPTSEKLPGKFDRGRPGRGGACGGWGGG